MAKQVGLGRGLSSLMGDGSRIQPVISAQDRNILPVDSLVAGNFQPRRLFSEDNLRDLAESIQKNGVILPIIVRPSKTTSGQYEIIAGERRWRASRMVGLATIPAVIRELEDKEALEFALIENIQRQDLTPLEEADGYCRLIEEFSYTQENLATRLGKSRSHIANLLRLLSLPAPVKELLDAGSISMGHARALVSADNAEILAHRIVKDGLSVRQIEKLLNKNVAKDVKKQKSTVTPPKEEEIDEISQIAHGLSHSLGMPVSIDLYSNAGKVSIAFDSLVQLDKILQLLGRTV